MKLLYYQNRALAWLINHKFHCMRYSCLALFPALMSPQLTSPPCGWELLLWANHIRYTQNCWNSFSVKWRSQNGARCHLLCRLCPESPACTAARPLPLAIRGKEEKVNDTLESNETWKSLGLGSEQRSKNYLSVGVFYCGIILLDEDALDKLYCLWNTTQTFEKNLHVINQNTNLIGIKTACGGDVTGTRSIMERSDEAGLMFQQQHVLKCCVPQLTNNYNFIFINNQISTCL